MGVGVFSAAIANLLMALYQYFNGDINKAIFFLLFSFYCYRVMKGGE